MSNFRGISLLVSFSKILEKVVARRVMKYFQRNYLFSEAQFGFCPEKSTCDAVHSIVNFLYGTFEERKVAVGVFLDLAKAFDSLDRKKLFTKLNYYGITGTALRWFESYLCDRRQYARYNGELSDEAVCNYGVPQGGILPSILFITYINDIVRCVGGGAELVMYADDTTVYASGASVEECTTKIIGALNNINEWMENNSLALNTQKSTYMVFKRKQNRIVSVEDSVRVNGTSLERVECMKFLGVTLDENLLWNKHVNIINNKISKYVLIFYRLRNSLTFSSMKLMYDSLVLPNLTYCSSIWGGCYKTYVRTLEMLQRKIVRLISFSSYHDHASPLLTNLRILNILNLNIYMCCNFVFKQLKNNDTLFQIYQQDRYNTRASNAYLLSFPNIMSTHSRHSIAWAGVRSWNGLPVEIRLIQNYNTFKINLKKYLLEQQGGVD